eukprot:CAMPEP_0184739118 /NCGR_PEP_ID=MMETSP0315-20130426/1933_1 /TAXON_ID=101924 /ORGANISM="Rhodosorus marinus, Strain UTEX LB 2760" /LENGTH=31 /DNA_ID= /DNA_START= /DNA_END= /DNA_ORIENTATION=
MEVTKNWVLRGASWGSETAFGELTVDPEWTI